MAAFFANLPPCLIGMEACGSAHHWARKLQGFGHTVRLMAPQFVKPYVKTQQERRGRCRGDLRGGGAAEHALRADQERRAAGGAVAAPRASGIRQGAHGAGQPDPRAAGRVRARHPAGHRHIAKRVPELLEDASNELPGSFRQLVAAADWIISRNSTSRSTSSKRRSRPGTASSELSRKLEKIPGIGPLTASALVASHRRREELRQRPAARGLAGAGAATALQRRQAEAAGHQQARRRRTCARC